MELVEWDKHTINNILNTGFDVYKGLSVPLVYLFFYDVYKKSVNTTEVIAKEKQKGNPQVSFQFVELGGNFNI
jgi:hypothetical protein